MERQTDTLKTALNKANINHLKVFDISYLELNNQFLEGTGSLVLDRVNKTAFAVYSPRTTYAAVELWCKRMGYRYITFRAYDDENLPIYHTNVMMSIGNEFAVLAADAIADKKERQDVLIRLKKINKEIITISKKQVNDFCANILQLKNAAGERKIILSQTAFEAFSLLQKKMLGKFGELVPVKIPTIETVGGGSARCMLAEVFR